MRKLLTCFVLMTCFATADSQSTSVDAIALKIPASSSTTTQGIIDYINVNLRTDSDKVRASYVWVANNINYDLKRLQAHDIDANMAPQAVDDVLNTRFAVCQGYSEVFAALCKGVGIKAAVVSGYTKSRGVIASISHAWVAVYVGGSWSLYDPTWAAGYIQDNQFTRSFNNRFYKIAPADMIKDHIPFDPMYQFLSYPVTNKEFIEGTVAATKALFNYNDTLKAYESLSKRDQLLSELRRVESSGVRTDLVLRRVTYLKNNLESFASKDNFTEANNLFKEAVGLYQEYIDHKNKKFSDIMDNQLEQLLEKMMTNARTARSLFSSLQIHTDLQRQSLSNNIHNIENFQTKLIEEKAFVDKYISTDQGSRRQLFMRRIG